MAEPVAQMVQPQANFKHETAAPTRKVAVGGIAGAMVTVVVFVLNNYLKTPIPADVATALTVMLSFAVSYWVPPAPTDQVVPA
jgi:putative flippase GtrA